MGIEFHVIDKPVLTVSLLDGGDLEPNTTYYFVAIHIYDHLEASATAFTCSAQSVNSDQISITTTSTKKSISMQWTESGYPGSSLILKWDYVTLLNPDGTYKNEGTHEKWNKAFSLSGWTGTSKTILSSDLLTNARLMNKLGNGNLCIDEPIDSKIDFKNFGIPFITSDGYVSRNEFIAAIEGSVIRDCFLIKGSKTLYSYCHIYLTDGRLYLTNMILYFESSMIHTRVNSQLIMNDCAYTLATLCQIKMYGTFTRVPIISGGVYRHQSRTFNPIFINTTTFYLQFGTYTDVAGLTMIEGGLNTTYLESTDGVNDCTFNSTGLNMYRSKYALLQRCKFNGGGYGVYDIEINTYQDENTIHDFKDCTTDRPDGLIMVRQSGIANTDTCPANFYFSVAVAVNIEGSTIEFIDSQGTIYTNPSEVLAYYNVGDPSVTTLKSVTTNLNPFTCRVTKEGYQPYEVTMEILKPIELVVELKQIIPPIYIDRQISGSVASQIIQAEAITQTTIKGEVICQ